MDSKYLKDIDQLNDMLDENYMLVDFKDGYVIHVVERGTVGEYSVWKNDQAEQVNEDYMKQCILYKRVDD